MDPFIGEIRPAPYGKAPRQWALCQGQLLPIAQNRDLYKLLGTFYGGDGKTTFALPDLRGRIPIGSGQGHGLQNYNLGQAAGAEAVVLTAGQMASHSHAVNAAVKPTSRSPIDNLPSTAGDNVYDPPTPPAALGPDAVTPTGNNQPHENRQPFLVIDYIIALQGIFPPR